MRMRLGAGISVHRALVRHADARALRAAARRAEVARRDSSQCCTSIPSAAGAAANARRSGSRASWRGAATRSIVAARAGEPLARARTRGRPRRRRLRAGQRARSASRRGGCAARFAPSDIDVVHAHTAHAVAVGGAGDARHRVPLVVARRVDFRLRDNVGTRLEVRARRGDRRRSRAPSRRCSSRAASRRLGFASFPTVSTSIAASTPATRDVLASLGVARGAPLVVQVAQLVGHKDPLNFVRAMARARERVPAVQALLVGDGPLRADVEREIASLGSTGVVHLAGYRTDADALLAAADVACLSSSEEGMGSVLLDALAFGRPVRRDARRRNSGGDRRRRVGPARARARSTRARRRDRRRCSQMTRSARGSRANARARAAEFSVERMTDRTIEVYEEVLSARWRRARERALRMLELGVGDLSAALALPLARRAKEAREILLEHVASRLRKCDAIDVEHQGFERAVRRRVQQDVLHVEIVVPRAGRAQRARRGAPSAASARAALERSRRRAACREIDSCRRPRASSRRRGADAGRRA